MDELVAALVGAATLLLLEAARLVRESRARRRGQVRTRVEDQADGQRTDI